MSDIGVVETPGMSSPSHLLSVIRANEAAQAAIAKAVEAAKGAGHVDAQGQAGGLEATNGCGQSSAPRPLLRLGVPTDLSLVWLRADRVSVLKTFPSNESFILEYSWFRC